MIPAGLFVGNPAVHMSEHLAGGLAADAKPLGRGALALVLNHHGTSHFGV